MSAVKIIDEDRLVNSQTHGINRMFSILRQWSCSCPATCQCTCVNQKRLTDGLTVQLRQLFCDIHIDIGMTLNCLRVICACRAVQTNSHQCRDITGTI